MSTFFDDICDCFLGSQEQERATQSREVDKVTILLDVGLEFQPFLLSWEVELPMGDIRQDTTLLSEDDTYEVANDGKRFRAWRESQRSTSRTGMKKEKCQSSCDRPSNVRPKRHDDIRGGVKSCIAHAGKRRCPGVTI
jgi:hypothetical protein